MITDPDEFFRDGCSGCARFASADCSARLWASGLATLRAIMTHKALPSEAFLQTGHSHLSRRTAPRRQYDKSHSRLALRLVRQNPSQPVGLT